MWTPISFDDLYEEIIDFEKYEKSKELLNLWKLIKILPEKWKEPEHGMKGGGFWAVAVIGEQVIWYNDIEEGFDRSRFTEYGTISEYGSGQNT